MFNHEKVYSFEDVLNSNPNQDMKLADLAKEYADKEDTDDEYNSMISCAIAEESKKLNNLHATVLKAHPDALERELLPSLQNQSMWIRSFTDISTMIDEVIDGKKNMFSEQQINRAMETMKSLMRYVPVIRVGNAERMSMLLCYPDPEYRQYVVFLNKMGKRLFKMHMFMHWWIK